MEPGAELDLPTEQLPEVRRLLSEILPGVRIWAHGSRVRGTARRASDLDLLLFIGRADPRLYELREAFEESDLPFIVDVHVWDEIPAEWREGIERAKVELVSG
jgi:type I restriction enzyme S subunit